MSTRRTIQERVISACEQIMLDQKYISLAEVLKMIGLIKPIHEDSWRKGKIPNLEMMIEGSESKIIETINCFIEWISKAKLTPLKIVSYARTSQKRPLQYSKDGDSHVESLFQTYYFSPNLTQIALQKLQDKLQQEPELVVFWTISDSVCSTCKKEMLKGEFLLMEGDSPLCMSCAGLGHLVFLPRGDAKLTRLANQYSTKTAVVVRFSKTRKRYEREGILVESEALQKAESEV
jgi:hypothetical protein